MKKVLATIVFIFGIMCIIGSANSIPDYHQTDMYRNRDSYNIPNTYPDYQYTPRQYNDDDECDHSGPGECVKQL